MFTHTGETRTHKHNLQIATLLSFVAGFVNVAGFVSIHQLTTNITGHFAFFVGDLYQFKWSESLIFFAYILSFFLGAFVSSMLIEFVRRKSEKNIFILPVLIEIAILFFLSVFGNAIIQTNANAIAVLLLFAMGLQNSLVTRISNAVVRTTHLTGLFTDLGIEVSQLIFFRNNDLRRNLKRIIHLRFRIILFFFLGGIIAGICYKYFKLNALFLPSAILLIGLGYDSLRVQFRLWKSGISS